MTRTFLYIRRDERDPANSDGNISVPKWVDLLIGSDNAYCILDGAEELLRESTVTTYPGIELPEPVGSRRCD